MKILVCSDSHGNIRNIMKAIHTHEKIEMVIHLGDVTGDIIKARELHKDMQFEFIRGNNDWSSTVPLEKLLLIEDKRLFITHGHHYNVKFSYERLIARGKEINADAVFFGHTHLTEEQFIEGMLVLNPGSISLPSGGAPPTYCVVEIKEGRIWSRFFRV